MAHFWWVLEDLVEMTHVLDDSMLPGSRQVDVVKHLEVLYELTESYASRVRTDRDPVLVSHQIDSNDLVDASHSGRINLTDLHGTTGQELLEHDSVLTHLSRGNLDSVGSQSFSNLFVAKDVISTGGFFDPVDVVWCQLFHPFYGLLDSPLLVGIHCHLGIWTHALPDHCKPPLVVLKVLANFQLEGGEPQVQKLFAQPLDFLVRITQPSDL